MPRSRSYPRSERMEELLRREVSGILLREVKDPRVGTVTITRVKVTRDLREATLSYGVLGRTAAAEEVQQALEQAAGYIHHLLVRRLAQKIVPRLSFLFDRNLDYSFHISKLLKEIEESDGGGE